MACVVVFLDNVDVVVMHVVVLYVVVLASFPLVIFEVSFPSMLC